MLSTHTLSTYLDCHYCKSSFTHTSSLARHLNTGRCKKFKAPQKEEEKLAMAKFKSTTNLEDTRKGSREDDHESGDDEWDQEDDTSDKKVSATKKLAIEKALNLRRTTVIEQEQKKKNDVKRKSEVDEGQSSKHRKSEPRVIMPKLASAGQSTGSARNAGKTMRAKKEDADSDFEVTDQDGFFKEEWNKAETVTVKLSAKQISRLMAACGSMMASLVKGKEALSDSD